MCVYICIMAITQPLKKMPFVTTWGPRDYCNYEVSQIEKDIHHVILPICAI